MEITAIKLMTNTIKHLHLIFIGFLELPGLLLLVIMVPVVVVQVRLRIPLNHDYLWNHYEDDRMKSI